jgi:hypothetical protein
LPQNDGRDALRQKIQERIGEWITVRMRVDKSRRDYLAACIDGATRRDLIGSNLAYERNRIPPHQHICCKPSTSGAVDDRAVTDPQIVATAWRVGLR